MKKVDSVVRMVCIVNYWKQIVLLVTFFIMFCWILFDECRKSCIICNEEDVNELNWGKYLVLKIDNGVGNTVFELTEEADSTSDNEERPDLPAPDLAISTKPTQPTQPTEVIAEVQLLLF